MEKLTLVQLKQKAKTLKLTGYSSLKKSELINLLQKRYKFAERTKENMKDVDVEKVQQEIKGLRAERQRLILKRSELINLLQKKMKPKKELSSVKKLNEYQRYL